MEGGQPDLAPGVVLKEDGDDLGEIMDKGSSTGELFFVIIRANNNM